MNNYVINIDRIQLTFNNTDVKLRDKKDFTIHYLQPNKHTFSYKSNILIKYQDIDFIYLSHKLKLNESISVIKLLNNTLYTLDYNIILLDFINTFKIIDYKITDLEVCINTNTQLTTKYYKSFKKDKIIFDKDYTNNDTFDFGQTKQLLTKDYNNRTFYIYKKNIKKTFRLLELRIENKTNEITDKNNYKKYILDYYKNRGLGTTKNIYRMELTINFSKLRKTCYDTKYKDIYDINSPYITQTTFNKLSIDKTNYRKFKFFKKYEIEIILLKDKDYLTELFNSFIMINYNILLETTTTKKLLFETTPRMIVKDIPPTSLENDNYKNEFNDIFSLF